MMYAMTLVMAFALISASRPGCSELANAGASETQAFGAGGTAPAPRPSHQASATAALSSSAAISAAAAGRSRCPRGAGSPGTLDTPRIPRRVRGSSGCAS